LDFAAALGVDPEHREALLWARSQLVVASAAAGLPGPVDGVTRAVQDDAVLRSDVEHAKGLGFAGKLCIHPAQLALTRALLDPSEEEVAWARRVLAVVGAENAGGVMALDGLMVDAPVVKRAHSIIVSVRGK
jgi:citrate lyase subunit beta/citryl-CoA lyase